MAIAVDRAPRLAEDLSAVYFGIHEAKKPADRLARRTRERRDPGRRAGNGRHHQPAARQRGDGGESVAHSLEREGSAAPVAADRAGSAGSRVHVPGRVPDRRQQVRSVGRRSAAQRHRRRRTTTSRSAPTRATTSSRRRTPAARTRTTTRSTCARASATWCSRSIARRVRVSSPNGKEELYWGDDGNYWVLDLATGAKRNITKATAVNFSNTDDDHNYLVPPPRAPFGWTRDGASVLLSDGWDIWKVPTTGTGIGGEPHGERQARSDPLQPRLPVRARRHRRVAGAEAAAAGGGGGASLGHRSLAAALRRHVRRVDEEGRPLARRSGHAGREVARLGRRELRFPEGARRRRVRLHAADVA